VIVLLRRLLVVQMLMLWMGGFVFYTAVVVPIGTEVLGSALEQSRITRWVSRSINLIGIATLAVLLIETACCRPARRAGIVMLVCTLSMAILTTVLIGVRNHMLTLVNFDAMVIVNREELHGWHRVYLWTISLQWAISVVYLLTMLSAWRSIDRMVAK